MKRRTLPRPIAQILDDRDADARARQLVRRMAVPKVSHTRAPFAFIAASLGVLGVAFALQLTQSYAPPSPQPAVDHSVLVRGGRLRAGRQSLGDGSWVDASDDIRALTVETNDATLELLIERGRLEFEIVPGGARRVEIEAGLARITVVGTHFTVSRSAGLLEVSVSRGEVLVRGELVPGRARIVLAGESIAVRESVAVPTPTALLEAPASEEMRPARRSSRPPWRDLAERGAYTEAWEALGADGFERAVRTSTPAELLTLADVARRSGHPEQAVPPLELLLTRFPDDPDAALGAFTLGRLRADALDQPARAAEAFERALGGRLPRTLVPDTLSRLALAHERAGDHERARRSAMRYLTSYPTGARATEMHAIVGEE